MAPNVGKSFLEVIGALILDLGAEVGSYDSGKVYSS